MRLITNYITSEEVDASDILTSEDLEFYIDLIELEEVQYIMLDAGPSNSLIIKFNEERQGKTSLILNDKMYNQRESLTSKSEITEAFKKYYAGKNTYKLSYNFELIIEDVKKHKADKELRDSIHSSLDYDDDSTSAPPEKYAPSNTNLSGSRKRRKKSENAGAYSLIFSIAIFAIGFILRSNRNSSPPRINIPIEQVIKNSQKKKHPKSFEDTRYVEVIKLFQDDQTGFHIMYYKQLDSLKVDTAYLSQSIPKIIQTGSQIELEPLNLPGIESLKYPLVYIKFN